MSEPRSVRDLLDDLMQWRVRAARGTGKARVSLRDLSAASGVPLSSLGKYLSGATLMPPDVLDAVVLALGATPGEARAWAQAWEDAAAAQLRAATERPPDAAANNDATAVSDAGPVPRVLPADVPAFTGRESALTELDGLLARGAGAAPVIATIVGTAGVGKTALAVHWAHRVAGRFPDGQLYVNLRGYDPGEPMSAQTALELLLRVLGLDTVPVDPELRAAMYRSTLADRRMLVVADNARAAEQVRPLLPGAPGCLLVVTSRDNLTGLVAREGARRLNLERLSDDEAISLLGQLLGEKRVLREPEACDELVRLCAGLPLALRVAAERVACRPRTPLAELVEELADDARRLDLLGADGDTLSDVRAVFSWSMRDIAEPAVGLFQLLGLVPGPEIDAHGAANLAGLPVAEARRLLDTLVVAHLVDRSEAGRYSMHDLLRVYATEQAADRLTAADRHDALTRLLDWYLATGDRASDLVNANRRHLPGRLPEPAVPGPVLATDTEARAWLEAELPGIMAAIRLAADQGWPEHAWRLPTTLWSFFFVSGYLDDWISANLLALTAAQHLGDAYAQAEARHALGSAYFTMCRYEQGLEHLDEALRCWRAIGDRRGEAATLNTVGSAYHRMQDYDRAQEYFELALAANQDTGERYAQALNLANLALTAGSLGRYREAIARFGEVMKRLDEVGDRHWHPQSLGNIGRLRVRLGEYADAVADLRAAAELSEETGIRRGLPFIYNGLALAHLARGEYAEAADYADRSITVGAQMFDPDDEAHALALLGRAHIGLGDTERGLALLRQALGVCAGHDSPRWTGTIHNDFGEVLLARGEAAAALEKFRTALAASKNVDVYEQGRAEYGIARVQRTVGEPWEPAIRRALDVFTALQTPEAAAIRQELAGHCTVRPET